jgi:hypothetical protein
MFHGATSGLEARLAFAAAYQNEKKLPTTQAKFDALTRQGALFDDHGATWRAKHATAVLAREHAERRPRGE